LVNKNIRKITIFVRDYQIQHKESKMPSEILLFDGFGQVFTFLNHCATPIKDERIRMQFSKISKMDKE
jgi:hypothetical protein